MEYGKKWERYFTAEYLKQSLNDLGKLLLTKKFWYELLVMTLAMFVAAMGVHFFMVPSKLIFGSITGLSMVLAKILPFASLGTIIFIINFILLILSFILIGNEFGAKTVYTALILGPMVDFLGKVVPLNESLFALPIAGEMVSDPWFDLLCLVLVVSLSQSILFSINASTGGLDIIAKIVNKFLGVPLGTSVTIAGALICCTAFLIHPVRLVLIGILGTWLNGTILNNFMLGLSSKSRALIISKDYLRIQEFVINNLKRGVTLHEVTGGYSNEKSMQLELLMTREELSTLMEFLKKEDIHSFVTVDSVNEVHGLWNRKKGSKRTAN